MPPAPLPTTTFTNNYRHTIYDKYSVNSRITSTKSANVTTAKATYYISHSCIQDLSISLVAADGRSYPLESSSYGASRRGIPRPQREAQPCPHASHGVPTPRDSSNTSQVRVPRTPGMAWMRSRTSVRSEALSGACTWTRTSKSEPMSEMVSR